MEDPTRQTPQDDADVHASRGGPALPVAVDGERLRDAAGASWRAARARLARVGDDVRIEARSTAHAAERYARARPWRVAGAAAVIALLAGVVIGVQLSRVRLSARPRILRG